jgi:hypothetical protein
VRETVGDNTNNNPYREVIKVFGKDGELVAQRDGMYPYSQAEMISFVTYAASEGVNTKSDVQELFDAWEIDRKRP